MIHLSHSLTETEELAKNFLTNLVSNTTRATIVGLYGDLGAGKTTFTQVIARELGIKGPVTSPTFILEKVYKITVPIEKSWRHLIHIDAYRLESADELRHLGWRELEIDPQNLILVEWADRVEEVLSKDAIKIYFKYVDENSREISW